MNTHAPFRTSTRKEVKLRKKKSSYVFFFLWWAVFVCVRVMLFVFSIRCLFLVC